MRQDRVDPESCLRSLTADALLWAHPQRPLFPVSLGVMAVANAFVMLGLLPEPLAEAILAEHRSELERQGLGRSEEHTSELQSHVNLVCRLLLEKKKKKKKEI